MAAKKVAGSIRKLTIEGISFDVAADATFSEIFTNFENAMVPTSGLAMRKMTKRIPAVEGVVLITDADERLVLKDFAEGLDNVKITYQNAATDSYRCEGTIEIEGNETEENRTACTIQPAGVWTKF
jgi:hypothetical protein